MWGKRYTEYVLCTKRHQNKKVYDNPLKGLIVTTGATGATVAGFLVDFWVQAWVALLEGRLVRLLVL